MSESPGDLIGAVHAWDHAMTTNDADAIGRFMADDWVIIGPDGSLDTRERFLSLIRSGDLTHSRMESRDIRTRFFGDTALVIAEGTSVGAWRSQAFHLVERVSCVYHRVGPDWRCHSTHLSLISDPVGPR
jgi:ketosteroid isomerase-like protein